jgi:hypothetical protein
MGANTRDMIIFLCMPFYGLTWFIFFICDVVFYLIYMPIWVQTLDMMYFAPTYPNAYVL